MFLFGLFVLFDHIRICYPDTEIYWISNRVVRLSVLVRRVRVSIEGIYSTVSGLLFEILIISPLLFLPSHPFHFLSLWDIDLISVCMLLIIEFFLPFSRFSSLFFLNLILQKTFQHIPLVIHPWNSLFLISESPLMKLLNLSSLKIISMLLSLSINNCSLIFVNILKCVLILHKLIIVLFVYWIFLSLYLITNHHLLIELLFLTLLLFFLPSSHLLSHC